ncbi:MAG: type II toxin-antitoxin system VapC family toxin [Anaerolineae bacterium]
MGIANFYQRLAGLQLIALDTMVFIYHLAGHPRYVGLTTAVLEMIEAGKVTGITTTVTLAEILAAPARSGDRRALLDYELYLTNFPHLRIVPFDVALAREAALVRGMAGLRTPDAIQVAAARLAGADAILTNDRRWVGRVDRPAVMVLDDWVEE